MLYIIYILLFIAPTPPLHVLTHIRPKPSPELTQAVSGNFGLLIEKVWPNPTDDFHDALVEWEEAANYYVDLIITFISAGWQNVSWLYRYEILLKKCMV